METVGAGRQQLNTVVSDWEDKYIQYLGHIQKNIQAGKASEEEVYQIEKLERTAMLYELMMNNIIEENGAWLHRGPQMNTEESLKLLIERIISIQKVDGKILESALLQAATNGNLNCHVMSGKVRWQWQDFL